MHRTVPTDAIEGVHFYRYGGRVFPYVGGGSDTAPPASTAVEFLENLEQQQSAPDPEPAPAAAPAGGDDSSSSSTPDPDVFPRDYVEELRQEAGKYRTRAQPFLDAFDGYDDEARDVMLGLTRALRESPESAARDMIEISRALLGDEFDRLISGDTEPKPLTREDLEREFQAREEQAAQERLVAQIESEVRELGYEKDSDAEAMLYGVAARRGGDIGEAHKFLQDLRQVAVDEYLNGKRQQSEAFVPVTTDGVTASNETGPPKDFAEASARMRAML